jgi:hypothetical protein
LHINLVRESEAKKTKRDKELHIHILLASQECRTRVFVSCGAGVVAYDKVMVKFVVMVIAVKVEVVVEFLFTRMCNCSRCKMGGADVLSRGPLTSNSTHNLQDTFL